MAIVHYTKRVIECIFIHIYSKQSKSLNKLIWSMAYTWLLFGIGVSYYLFHPNFYEPYWVNFEPSEKRVFFNIFFGIFLFCELMNFLCHVHLKSLRKSAGDNRRGIPTLHGFSTVTCANYFWEYLAWVIFTIVT